MPVAFTKQHGDLLYLLKHLHRFPAFLSQRQNKAKHQFLGIFVHCFFTPPLTHSIYELTASPVCSLMQKLVSSFPLRTLTAILQTWRCVPGPPVAHGLVGKAGLHYTQ